MIRRYGLFALVVLLGLGAGLRDGFDRWVSETILPVVLTETSVEVRDRDGHLLRVFPVEDGRVRLAVQVADVDPSFVSMLIRYEDQRFYTHQGVDPLAILRAAAQAVWVGAPVSGGSTLTMQVARLLENSGTGRWQGKVRQMRLALALERRFSKEDILDLYLLHAPYGGNLEGIRAGTLAWFGKEPRRLTTAEAALMIALPQSPERRRPDRHAEAAAIARDRVLARVGMSLDRHPDVPIEMQPFVRLAPHLADEMRRQADHVTRHDLTIDADVQMQIEDLARRAIQGQAAGVSAAIVVADHRTGAVLASAGSAQYGHTGGTQGFVDMTRAVRSPGSTLKPFIYGLAFDEGLAHPATIMNDAPIAFGRYAPQNFDGMFRGEVTVRDALQLSLNIPPVILLEELGPARLMSALRRGGAHPVVPGGQPGLAIGLGGIGLTLNDLVSLYAGLAQGGVARPLQWRMGTQIEDGSRLISRSAAWQVSHILAGLSPPQGTAVGQGKIAYKTGTSYGHRDAWAVGFDGAHVIGVWLGRPDGTPVPGAFGGDLAAPILFEAFGRVAAERVPLPPPPPETLLVSTSALPNPLQRFRSRGAAFVAVGNALTVQFPPQGAILAATGDGLPLKLRSGTLPLSVLVNGVPVTTGVRQRDLLLAAPEPGFTTISVIDAKGRSAKVDIRLE